MLINEKNIFNIMSMINFMLNWVEHEKKMIRFAGGIRAVSTLPVPSEVAYCFR